MTEPNQETKAATATERIKVPIAPKTIEVKSAERASAARDCISQMAAAILAYESEINEVTMEQSLNHAVELYRRANARVKIKAEGAK